ncbi:MAG: amidase [Gammaproteobacteria bacterium]
MAFAEYDQYDGVGLAALVRQREISAAEVLEEAIRRAEAVDPVLNFLCHRAYDDARRAAADPALPAGPLQGVPWLVKELATAWSGHPYTNALPYMKDVIAPFDSETLRRLKAAGMVPFGKSTSPENGWKLATESTLFGITRSPWDPERTPGGSSGGAAAAVAARVLPMAEASDGGGSVRAPAANCGLVGLKPARGRVTLAPAVADYWYGGAVILGVSRTVRDTAALLDVTHGHLPGEPYQIPPPARPFVREVGADPGRLRIAMVTASPDHGTPVDPQIRDAVERTAQLLESLGHHVEPQPVPYAYRPLQQAYTAIVATQTAAFFDSIAPLVGRPATREDMAPVYWSMCYKGRSFSGVQHASHVETVRMLSREIVGRMAAFDLWLMPTVPMLPRPHGYYDMRLDIDTYDDTLMGPDCCFTLPFNATGAPAISVPAGLSREGWPIGVQFVGQDCGEAALLRIAAQIETARPWNHLRPRIVSGA